MILRRPPSSGLAPTASLPLRPKIVTHTLFKETPSNCSESPSPCDTEGYNGSEPEEEEAVVISPLSPIPKGEWVGSITLFATSHNTCGKCGDWSDINPADRVSPSIQPLPIKREAYAIICGRSKAIDGNCKLVHLWLQDKSLVTALKPIFRNHLYCDPASLRAPFHPFSQQWSVFEQIVADEPFGPTEKNLRLLRTILKPAVDDAVNACQTLTASGRIAYGFLREAFVPGEIVLAKTDDGCLIAGRLGSMYRVEFGAISYWRLDVFHFDWDGIKGVIKPKSYEVKPYSGTRALVDLDIMPLHHHHEKDQIRMELIARGRKFESLRHGVHFMYYAGKGKDPNRPGQDCDVEEFSVMLDEPMVVATKYFHDYEWSYPRASQPASKLNAQDIVAMCKPKVDDLGFPHCRTLYGGTHSISHSHKDYSPPDAEPDPSRWTDDHCLMAFPYIRAFSESRKTWYKVNVNQMSDIAWKIGDMEKVILNEHSKYLMRCATHKLRLSRDGGEAANCGMGLFTVLLYGAPGTGKMTTVKADFEVVLNKSTNHENAACEEQGLLPYKFDAAALASIPSDFKQELEYALRRCTHFKIPLVVRNAHHILGNAEDGSEQNMASSSQYYYNILIVFFEETEGFNGLVLLITNQNETFPPAIESRIDARLHYSQFSKEVRAQIWSNELDKDRIAKRDVAELASHQLDGRQIKGVIKTARLLAETDRDQITSPATINAKYLQEALYIRLQGWEALDMQDN
ncbi:hypothetical protein BGZ63DRAFT_401242 [Mariannaea sp. PMI_226]|nr:hypothetical protein BGZ63DRAFT_401242 [Mariannaea sp. PMI_226]